MAQPRKPVSKANENLRVAKQLVINSNPQPLLSMLNTLINFGRKRLALLDEHTFEVLKKSSASMLVKMAGMIIGLGVSVYLGRTLGAEGLGIINLSNRLINLLMTITMLGLPQVVLKFTAIAYEKKDWQTVGNTIFTATLISSTLALILSVIGYFVSTYLATEIFKEPQLEVPLKITFLILLPRTLSQIFANAVNGFRKIWQSNLVNETLSMWIVGLCLTGLHVFKVEINVINIAIVYAIGRIGVTLAVTIYWKHLFTFKGKTRLIARPILKIAMPMLLISSTSIIAANANTLMLGWLGDMKDVGLYNVAMRLAMLTIFIHAVTVSALSPKIAALYEQGKIKNLEKMVQNVTKLLIVIGALSVALFALFGKSVLGFWGDEFKAAYLILLIISIGQFFNIGTGATGIILIMTGHEKITSRITLISLGLNILLNFILIQQMGIIGAAIATAATVSSENIIKIIIVKRKTGITTIAF